MTALSLEVGVLALMLLVFVGGLFGRRDDTRRVGVISAVGLVALFYWSLHLSPGASFWGGAFVQDELALFAKRLFLVATVLGVLGSLTLRAPVLADFEPYAAFFASPRSNYEDGPLTRGAAWKEFASVTGQWMLKGYGAFSIEDRATGAYLGETGIFHPAAALDEKRRAFYLFGGWPRKAPFSSADLYKVDAPNEPCGS